MSDMASQITSNSIVCSPACSGWHHREHHSSALLAISEWNPPVNGGSPHKGPLNVCQCHNIVSMSQHRVNVTTLCQCDNIVSMSQHCVNVTTSCQCHNIVSMSQHRANVTTSCQYHNIMSMSQHHVNVTTSSCSIINSTDTVPRIKTNLNYPKSLI